MVFGRIYENKTFEIEHSKAGLVLSKKISTFKTWNICSTSSSIVHIGDTIATICTLTFDFTPLNCTADQPITNDYRTHSKSTHTKTRVGILTRIWLRFTYESNLPSAVLLSDCDECGLACADRFDVVDGVDRFDGDDELLLLLLLLASLVEFVFCDTVSDVFFMSLSKSLIKSHMPPTSHSLSSYSKLFSFASVADCCCCCWLLPLFLLLLFKVLPLTLLVIVCLLLSVSRLLMATFIVFFMCMWDVFTRTTQKQKNTKRIFMF